MPEHDFQFGLRASRDDRRWQKISIKGKYIICVVVNSKRFVCLSMLYIIHHTYK